MKHVFDKCVVWDAPQIDVVQQSMPNMGALDRLALEPYGEHNWEPDASPLEILPIFAGRACYQSFGPKSGRKTAKDYLGHIKEVKHFSVIEHSYVSFYIQGVSRTFTHELVRHRIANYSQLSQRYVSYEDSLSVVIHPNLYDAGFTKEELVQGHREMAEAVQEAYVDIVEGLTEKWGSDSVATKKKIRETAREILPNCTETKIVVTMNLRAWLEMLQKRNSDGADGQIHAVASQIQDHLARLAPNIFGD